MRAPSPPPATMRSASAFVTAAVAAGWLAAPAAGEIFTTNAICRKQRCINPVFPGLEDLHKLEEAPWFCSSLRKVHESMPFCRAAVSYDPALPSLGTDSDVATIARKQDQAALTMFMYHLAGMGLEGWNYPEPEFADDCTKSIWRMACYTYFPRAKLGCQEGMNTQYLRPCQSSCQNYVRACGVECCDESVKCVFSHKKTLPGGVTVVQTGYAPHDGPSSLCTGAARRSSAAPSLLAWLLPALALAFTDALPAALGGARAAVDTGLRRGRWSTALGLAALAVLAMSLQGCTLDVPTHTVGNWRAEQDYLITYEFVPPGETSRVAMLNSCSLPDLAPTLQCGGRGVCRLWDERNLDNTISFCQCDRDWADPECSTRRKSQVVAFLLSLFLGPFGADQFYLGFHLAGGLKLTTLGGFGAWWVYDFIRIGSAPVDAFNFRVSADFPHWAFVLCTVMISMLIGFLVSYVTLLQHVSKRRKDALLLHAEEEHRMAAAGGGPAGFAATAAGPRHRPGMAQDYGSMGATASTATGPTFHGGPSGESSRWARDSL